MPSIRDLLQKLENSDAATLRRHCYGGFTSEDRNFLEKKGHPVYQGKVREVVKMDDHLFLCHTDRLSAFDRPIGHVPYKGTILTALSAYWLEQTSKIVPTHFRGMPHERVLDVVRAEPVKAEVIVRGYLAGSMLRAYEKGERRFCGEALPDGLKAHQRLPRPIITPTTKAEVYEHDEDTTPDELIKTGVVTREEWKIISEMALAIFAQGTEIYREKGWILVDTKYEFGRTKDGSIILIDEAHTPDSSRLWVADSFEERVGKGLAPDMLDKEIIRRYLMDQGFKGEGEVPEVPPSHLVKLAGVYLNVAETLLERPLMTAGPMEEGPPLSSVLHSLKD